MEIERKEMEREKLKQRAAYEEKNMQKNEIEERKEKEQKNREKTTGSKLKLF